MADREETRELSVTSALRSFRLIILFVIGIIIAVLIYLNIDQFNIDSLRRLLARLDLTFSTSASADGEILFSSGSNNVFAVFKDGPVVLSKEGLKVYDSGCNQLSTTPKIFKNPAVAVSKKYILSFDRGAKYFSVSNSFSAVFEAETDGAVINVHINNKGHMAVTSETAGYKSLVTVYDSDFDAISKLYFSNKYVIKSVISEDSRFVALISLVSNESTADTVVSVYKIGDESPTWEATITDDVAIDIAYRGGGLEVISPKAAYYYSKSGKLITTVGFTGGKLYSYSRSDNRTCFVCVSQTGENANHIMVTDEKGNMKMSAEFDEIVADTAFCSGGVAVLSGGKITVCKIDKEQTVASGKVYAVEDDADRILCNGNTAYIFTKSGARAVKLS